MLTTAAERKIRSSVEWHTGGGRQRAMGLALLRSVYARPMETAVAKAASVAKAAAVVVRAAAVVVRAAAAAAAPQHT